MSAGGACAGCALQTFPFEAEGISAGRHVRGHGVCYTEDYIGILYDTTSDNADVSKGEGRLPPDRYPSCEEPAS